jgi:hypothetical protein
MFACSTEASRYQPEPWLATGVDWRRLQAKGEDRLLGRGIFYGAARHDATNVVGKKVFIVETAILQDKLPCFCRAMRRK